MGCDGHQKWIALLIAWGFINNQDKVCKVKQPFILNGGFTVQGQGWMYISLMCCPSHIGSHRD